MKLQNKLIIICIYLIAGLLAGLQTGCSLFSRSEDSSTKNQYREDGDYPLVNEKYSITSDRKKLEELRGQVPQDKRQENDELAFMMEVKLDPKEGSRTPEQLRKDFDSVLRKKRDQFNKDAQKERELFTKEERKKRDAFLKEQADVKNKFKKNKSTREQTNEFYKEMDEKRKEFFSNERDKRNDYESDIRERRKSFDDYARAKQNEFYQEYRSYTKKFDELKKQLREKKSGKSTTNSSSNPSELIQFDKQFQEIQDKPSSPLGSGE